MNAPACGCKQIYASDLFDDDHCKYSKLKATAIVLMKLLKEQGRTQSDGTLCWCELPLMIPYRGHDANCDEVTVELKKAAEMLLENGEAL